MKSKVAFRDDDFRNELCVCKGSENKTTNAFVTSNMVIVADNSAKMSRWRWHGFEGPKNEQRMSPFRALIRCLLEAMGPMLYSKSNDSDLLSMIFFNRKSEILFSRQSIHNALKNIEGLSINRCKGKGISNPRSAFSKIRTVLYKDRPPLGEVLSVLFVVSDFSVKLDRKKKRVEEDEQRIKRLREDILKTFMHFFVNDNSKIHCHVHIIGIGEQETLNQLTLFNTFPLEYSTFHKNTVCFDELQNAILQFTHEALALRQKYWQRPLRQYHPPKEVEVLQSTWKKYENVQVWSLSANAESSHSQLQKSIESSSPNLKKQYLELLKEDEKMLISHYPFSFGGERNVFHLRLGRTGDKKWVGKENKHIEVSSEDERDFVCSHLVTQQRAAAYAFKFNQAVASLIPFNFPRVQFSPCYLVRAHHRYLFVEQLLEGNFIKWNDNFGSLHRKDDRHQTLSELVPQSFSHWTEETFGFMVCDIQGTVNRDEFHLSDPVIHSPSSKRGFGRTDRGKEGINDFYSSHKCNILCCLLGLRSNIKYNPSRTRLPTDVNTKQITVLKSEHLQLRQHQRCIPTVQLQKAIKHGKKNYLGRQKKQQKHSLVLHEFNGVKYITDRSGRRGITTFRAQPQKRRREEVKFEEQHIINQDSKSDVGRRRAWFPDLSGFISGKNFESTLIVEAKSPNYQNHEHEDCPSNASKTSPTAMKEVTKISTKAFTKKLKIDKAARKGWIAFDLNDENPLRNHLYASATNGETFHVEDGDLCRKIKNRTKHVIGIIPKLNSTLLWKKTIAAGKILLRGNSPLTLPQKFHFGGRKKVTGQKNNKLPRVKKRQRQRISSKPQSQSGKAMTKYQNNYTVEKKTRDQSGNLHTPIHEECPFLKHIPNSVAKVSFKVKWKEIDLEEGEIDEQT